MAERGKDDGYLAFLGAVYGKPAIHFILKNSGSTRAPRNAGQKKHEHWVRITVLGVSVQIGLEHAISNWESSALLGTENYRKNYENCFALEKHLQMFVNLFFDRSFAFDFATTSTYRIFSRYSWRGWSGCV